MTFLFPRLDYGIIITDFEKIAFFDFGAIFGVVSPSQRPFFAVRTFFKIAISCSIAVCIMKTSLNLISDNFFWLIIVGRFRKSTRGCFYSKGTPRKLHLKTKNGAHKVKTFLKSRQNKPLWLKWSLKTSQDESRWWKESLPSAWMNKNELKVHAWTKMNFVEKIGISLGSWRSIFCQQDTCWYSMF